VPDAERHVERWPSRRAFLLAAMGAAIGLGNVWRFPYVVYKNGASAFLLPYILAFFLLGVPLLLLELSLGQKLQVGVVKAFNSIHPSLRGIGWVMIAGSFLIVSYYNVIMSWSLRYLVASFRSNLPWAGDEENYFQSTILGLANNEDITDTGGLQAWTVLGLAITWICIYFAIFKGVKSSGVVVYITVPLPFILLAILFVRGVTLDGASDGIEFYLKPDFKILYTDVHVWTEAVTQIFFSLGVGQGIMGGFASYNHRNQNVYKDTMIIALSNSFTSIIAGFTVFSVLGHMAHVTPGKTVEDVVQAGPGLAFVAFPAALELMPASSFFSVLFFLMLLTLGIDSAFANTEAITTVLKDAFNLRPKMEPIVTIVLCMCGFLSGLIFATNAGIFWLDLIDHFVSSFLLLPVGLAECIAIGWIYGSTKHIKEVNQMANLHLSTGWGVLWKWVAPFLIAVVLIVEFVDELSHPLRQQRVNRQFPTWALAIGWICVTLPIFAALVMAYVSKRAKPRQQHPEHHRDPMLSQVAMEPLGNHDHDGM
jgi:neurotransmitter:Na+ symporter, NSS family